MKILLVNDDGIDAPGIWALARALTPLHEVVVVAPAVQRSGASHSITMHGPLQCAAYPNDVCPAFCLSGSPCDCVKFGLNQLAAGADCVISGINDCGNIGTDVLYSGTVNAAMEAIMNGLPGIAVSVKVKNNDYNYPAQFIRDNLFMLRSLCTNDRTVSVNMHSSLREELHGVRLASCGDRRFDDYYVKEDDGYHLYGTALEIPNAADSDMVLYYQDYILVTPIRVQYTDPDAMREWQAVVSKLCW